MDRHETRLLEESQERVQLRKQSLQFWKMITENSKQADIFLINRSKVTGKLSGVDGKQENFHIDRLKTPFGIYSKATLCQNDISYMEFRLTNEELNKMRKQIK